jgi:O-antigen/teichoic acid export membrane protein
MRSFIKSSSTLMIGNLVTKFLSILYLIPLLRFSEELGLINGYLLVPFAFLILFGTFGLDVILTSELVKHSEDIDKRKNVAVTSFVIMVTTGLIASIVCFIFVPNFMVNKVDSNYLYVEQLINGAKILSLGIFIYAITSYFRGVLIAMGEYSVISISYMSEQVIKIIPILLAFYFLIKPGVFEIGSYAYILSITTVVSIVSTLALYMFVFFKKKYYHIFTMGTYKTDYKLYKFLFVSSIVFFAAGLFTSFFDMIDMYFMKPMLENSGDVSMYTSIFNEYFNYSMKFIMIPITTAAAFITVMIRHLHNNEEGNSKHIEFDRIINVSLVYGVISAAGMVILGPLLIELMYHKETIGIIAFQSLIIPFYIIRNIIGSYIVTNEGSDKSIIISMVMIILTKIIFDILLFPIFGIIAFIISSMLAIICSLMILILMNKHLFLLTKSSALEKVNIIVKGFLLLCTGYVIALIITNVINILFIQFLTITVLMFVATIIIFLKHIKLFLRR